MSRLDILNSIAEEPVGEITSKDSIQSVEVLISGTMGPTPQHEFFVSVGSGTNVDGSGMHYVNPYNDTIEVLRLPDFRYLFVGNEAHITERPPYDKIDTFLKNKVHRSASQLRVIKNTIGYDTKKFDFEVVEDRE